MLGEQIIKGMAVTARNFFGSYVSKERLTTVQYPEEHLAQKENTRQFPFLVYDGDDWKKVCAASRARFVRRNVRPSAFTSSRARTRSPITKASRSFIRPLSTLIFPFA